MDRPVDRDVRDLRYGFGRAFEPKWRSAECSRRWLRAATRTGSRTQETIGRGVVHNAGRRIPRYGELGLMPESFEKFANGLGVQLEAAALRALALLRWRSGELGAPLKRPGRLFEWTLGDGLWHRAPTMSGVTFDAISYPQLSATARADIVELYAQQMYEPFAYELIREAWSQRHEPARRVDHRDHRVGGRCEALHLRRATRKWRRGSSRGSRRTSSGCWMTACPT